MKKVICNSNEEEKILLEQLLNHDRFILFEAQDQDSLIKKYSNYFDKIFNFYNLYDLEHLSRKDDVVGIDLSHFLIKYFESNDLQYIALFKDYLNESINIVYNKNYHKDYLIAFNGIPLSIENFKLLKEFENLLILPTISGIGCEKYYSLLSDKK